MLKNKDNKDLEEVLKDKLPFLKDLLQKFSTVFKPLEGLPLSQPYDHQIKTDCDTKPPWCSLYHMSEEELNLFQEELTKLLKLHPI